MIAISSRRSFSACSGVSMRAVGQAGDFLAVIAPDLLHVEAIAQRAAGQQRRDDRGAVAAQIEHAARDIDARRPRLLLRRMGACQREGRLQLLVPFEPGADGVDKRLQVEGLDRGHQERNIFIGEVL